MQSLLKYWRRYRQSSGAQHEVVGFAICLAIGVTVMPLLIYLVGSSRLGPYANGGLFALWRDYVVALGHLSLVYWLVALGPYAALWMLRGARYLLRR
jgi:hypothetical protein